MDCRCGRQKVGGQRSIEHANASGRPIACPKWFRTAPTSSWPADVARMQRRLLGSQAVNQVPCLGVVARKVGTRGRRHCLGSQRLPEDLKDRLERWDSGNNTEDVFLCLCPAACDPESESASSSGKSLMPTAATLNTRRFSGPAESIIGPRCALSEIGGLRTLAAARPTSYKLVPMGPLGPTRRIACLSMSSRDESTFPCNTPPTYWASQTVDHRLVQARLAGGLLGS